MSKQNRKSKMKIEMKKNKALIGDFVQTCPLRFLGSEKIHDLAIISGLDSLGLVSLTSEALLSAMTWLAVHEKRSQIIGADSYV